VASWWAVKRSISAPFLLYHNTFSPLVRYRGQCYNLVAMKTSLKRCLRTSEEEQLNNMNQLLAGVTLQSSRGDKKIWAGEDTSGAIYQV